MVEYMHSLKKYKHQYYYSYTVEQVYIVDY